MAKFAGVVTYITQVESSPGVWTDQANEHSMRGDIFRISATNQDNGKVNGDVSLNHRISLVGDAYAFGNYHDIKCINVDGRNWEVTSIEVQRPRIIVTVGGLWNG